MFSSYWATLFASLKFASFSISHSFSIVRNPCQSARLCKGSAVTNGEGLFFIFHFPLFCERGYRAPLAHTLSSFLFEKEITVENYYRKGFSDISLASDSASLHLLKLLLQGFIVIGRRRSVRLIVLWLCRYQKFCDGQNPRQSDRAFLRFPFLIFC